MHILITAATAAELLPALEVREAIHSQTDNQLFIEAVETGIGSTATAYHTLKALLTASDLPYDMAINVGIAGSFSPSLPIGSVVRIGSDYFGDCGIQTASGFESLFDARLLGADTFPFTAGKLIPAPLAQEWESALYSLPIVQGVTVQHLVESDFFSPSPPFLTEVETMEGAAFFYVCMNERIPCLALRAVSNSVGDRDKSRWNIPLALRNLSQVLKNCF